MPTITMTITLEVPDGTEALISTPDAAAPTPAADSGVPADVLEAIRSRVPTRFREFVERYVTQCVDELGCVAELARGGRGDYLNMFPPPRCRKARVSGVTYSSSRTPVYTGAIDLAGYERAVETIDGGRYKYPKLPHLDDDLSVEEAIRLTKIAIERLER